MVRRSSRRALLLVAAVLLVSCDSNSSSGVSSGVTVKFVGNSTCPTNNQQPYFGPGVALPVNSVPAVGQAIDEMPHTHVAPPATVQYNHDPPTSGCHYNLGYGQAPITAGAYDQPVQPERWVHNLEHGYIVILYNCPTGCTNEFNQLHDWFKNLPADPSGAVTYAKVLILPEKTMSPHFAAICWDWYDPMDTLDMTEIQKFYDNHVNNSPEGPGTP